MNFKQFISEDGFWFNFDKVQSYPPKRKHTKEEEQGTKPNRVDAPRSAAQEMGQDKSGGQTPQQGLTPQNMPQQQPMKQMRK